MGGQEEVGAVEEGFGTLGYDCWGRGGVGEWRWECGCERGRGMRGIRHFDVWKICSGGWSCLEHFRYIRGLGGNKAFMFSKHTASVLGWYLTLDSLQLLLYGCTTTIFTASFCYLSYVALEVKLLVLDLICEETIIKELYGITSEGTPKVSASNLICSCIAEQHQDRS